MAEGTDDVAVSADVADDMARVADVSGDMNADVALTFLG